MRFHRPATFGIAVVAFHLSTTPITGGFAINTCINAADLAGIAEHPGDLLGAMATQICSLAADVVFDGDSNHRDFVRNCTRSCVYAMEGATDVGPPVSATAPAKDDEESTAEPEEAP